MASVSAGRYRIYNALNTEVALTVYNAQAKNGSNVFVYANGSAERDTSFADVWQLSYRADGTAQLINVYSGKSLDVASGKVSKGQNVQIYTDNDSRAQRWDLVASATGKTVTISGTTYDTYMMALHADTSYVCDVSGSSAASGKNVQLYTRDSSESSSDQLWAFVPVPNCESGGLVEVRSMASTSMALSVSGGSTTDGAGVTLAKAGSENWHKWLLTQESAAEGETPAKWSLRAWHSGKYLDAYGGSTAKTHVDQRLDAYAGNDTDAQRWDIERLGSATVDGKTADVVSVRSCLTGAGDPYYADAYDALHSSKPNVVLEAPRSSSSQQWAVIATEPSDGFAPMPCDIGVVAAVGDTDPATTSRWDARTVPTWSNTSAWSPSGANHYEVRHRRRAMASSTSAFADWSDWTEWEVAGVTVDGRRAWLTEGIPEDERKVDLADAGKLVEWEFQVRCVLADTDGIACGPAADCAVAFVGCPTVAIDATAGFSIDGLHLTYSSDYANGTTELTLTELVDVTTGTVLFGGSETFADLDEGGTLHVSRDLLGGVAPSNGDKLRATFGVGYDQASATDTGATLTAEVTVGYTASFDVAPTATMGEGRMLEVTCNAIEGGTNRLWVIANGATEEVAGTVEGGKATYSVAYPFGRDLEIWADAESADGDTWGTAMLSVPADSELFKRYSPCHAWNWDGGAFCLEIGKGGIETSRKLQPVYDAYTLDSRERQAVFFSPTIKGTFDADGVVLVTDTATDSLEKLLEMQKAHHVHYRAPSGETAEVAITDVSYTRHKTYATVSVSMIEEG